MTAALILSIAIIAVGAVLWIFERNYRRRNRDNESEPQPKQEDEECCGMHITCEKDSLLASVSEKIEYYEDEELDAFKNRAADSYTPEESELFREVLLTMRPDDIAGWARSLQLREIALPEDVRDELIMIISEARKAHASVS